MINPLNCGILWENASLTLPKMDTPTGFPVSDSLLILLIPSLFHVVGINWSRYVVDMGYDVCEIFATSDFYWVEHETLSSTLI